MAECKNSFVLYNEFIETFETLTDEDAGQLVKHLFRYVNDQNPETENPMVKLAFIPMKQQLKRDLKKYEKYIEKQSLNGAKGGRPAKPKETQKTQPFIEKPKKAEDVDVDVDDNSKKNYTKNDFFSDWNELRLKHLKKASNLKSFGYEEAENLKNLLEDYTPEDIRGALIGLFKQEVLPNNNTSMQSNPKHFLKFFNSYYSAYYDQNKGLYGTKQLEKTI